MDQEHHHQFCMFTKSFVYHPNEENGNFGSLEIDEGSGFKKFIIGNSDDMSTSFMQTQIIYFIGLNEPSHNVIFIDGALYILAGNVDLPHQIMEKGESQIEDPWI